jgi:hypothetical protein
VLADLIRKLGEASLTGLTATYELDIVPIIAWRMIVIGEERRVLAVDTPEPILRGIVLSRALVRGAPDAGLAYVLPAPI